MEGDRGKPDDLAGIHRHAVGKGRGETSLRERCPIRWHRFTAELCDQVMLRQIRDLYAEYYTRVRSKEASQPFVEFEHLNLTRFTMRILEFGIDVMKYRVSGGKPK